jgi:hypothetical protein
MKANKSYYPLGQFNTENPYDNLSKKGSEIELLRKRETSGDILDALIW